MDPCAGSFSSPDSCLLKYPSAGELQHPASEFIGFLSPKGADPRDNPSTRGIAFNGEKAYIKLNSVRKAWSELRSSICASPLFPGKFVSEVEFMEGCGARSEEPKLSSDGRSGQVFAPESRHPPFKSGSDRRLSWKIQEGWRREVGSQGKGQARMGREPEVRKHSTQHSITAFQLLSAYPLVLSCTVLLILQRNDLRLNNNQFSCPVRDALSPLALLLQPEDKAQHCPQAVKEQNPAVSIASKLMLTHSTS